MRFVWRFRVWLDMRRLHRKGYIVKSGETWVLSEVGKAWRNQ